MSECESYVNDENGPRAEWTKKEVEDLMVRRKGYVAGTFVTSGFPPDLEFKQIMDQIKEGDQSGKRERRKSKPRKPIEGMSITKSTKTTIESTQSVIQKEVSIRANCSAISFANTINVRTGTDHWIPVKEDTGTEVNWISSHVAKRLSLPFQKARSAVVYTDFSGNKHAAKYFVTLPLIGEMDNSQQVECFIAPERFPLDCVVVGSLFVETFGPPQSVFADKPEGMAMIMIQAAIKETEQSPTEAAEAIAEAKAAALAKEREKRKSGKAQGQSAQQSSTSSSSTAAVGQYSASSARDRAGNV